MAASPESINELRRQLAESRAHLSRTGAGLGASLDVPAPTPSKTIPTAAASSTAFVEPPSAEVTAIAFSNAFLVMICRAVMPFAIRFTTASPER